MVTLYFKYFSSAERLSTTRTEELGLWVEHYKNDLYIVYVIYITVMDYSSCADNPVSDSFQVCHFSYDFTVN